VSGGSVFATGADESYGYHLLNLLGSVKKNSDVFDRIVAFDLGLTEHQRALLAAVPGVDVVRVPPFVPHWARGFTWKPWAWTHAEGDAVFWLDAGATVLRPLVPALEQIRELGYFLVSQGNRLADLVPSGYARDYGISPEALARPYVAAGVIGFAPGSTFFEKVIVPTYEDCLRGRNLGFSAGEESSKNFGLNRGPVDAVHDCPHFRWDQTILNLHVTRELPDARIADLDEYGGWRSRRDHPRQVIWHHRRRGDLLYLPRVPYTGRTRLTGRAFGVYFALRWSAKLREHLRRRRTYVLKARALTAARARARR